MWDETAWNIALIWTSENQNIFSSGAGQENQHGARRANQCDKAAGNPQADLISGRETGVAQ
jgi:hypothetical protein